MVTAKTQLNLTSAKDYFQEHLGVGDYYEEGQRVSGEWYGDGSRQSKLSGVVHFSPPKSVSILALVAEDARLVEAHHRALRIALEEFEQFVAIRLHRKGARDYRVTQNIVAAQFTHDTSRALDPHLHTHCIGFNASLDAAEGRWKALENYDMMRARKYVENIYYHELAKDVRRFGYLVCNHPRGDFELEGVPAELCQRFSKRQRQIDEAPVELLRAKSELDGTNMKAIRERLATAERARRMRDVSTAELRSLWQGQLTRAENDQIAGLVEQQIVDEPAPQSRSLEEAIA